MERNVLMTIMIFVFIANNINCRTLEITEETFPEYYTEYTGQEKKSSSVDHYETFNDQVGPKDNIVHIFRTNKLKKFIKQNTYAKIVNEYTACINKAFNFTLIRNDLIEAEYGGDVEMVFKKHCKKIPDYLKCNENYEYNVNMLLEGDYIEDETKIKMVINEAAVTFMCRQDGERMALFYAESAVQCFKWKEAILDQCLNDAFNKYKQNSQSSSNKLRFEDQCNAVLDTQECVITTLSRCQNRVVAQFIEAWYDHFRRSTLCSKYKSVYRYVYQQMI